jgi:hypothetical protein
MGSPVPTTAQLGSRGHGAICRRYCHGPDHADALGPDSAAIANSLLSACKPHISPDRRVPTCLGDGLRRFRRRKHRSRHGDARPYSALGPVAHSDRPFGAHALGYAVRSTPRRLRDCCRNDDRFQSDVITASCNVIDANRSSAGAVGVARAMRRIARHREQFRLSIVSTAWGTVS